MNESNLFAAINLFCYTGQPVYFECVILFQEAVEADNRQYYMGY